VRRIQEVGRVVALVGAGAEDVRALRQADVGIAVDMLTRVPEAACDVIVGEGNLQGVWRAVLLGRRTLRGVRLRLAALMAYSAVAVILAGGGLYALSGMTLGPAPAALAMAASVALVGTMWRRA
jgi:Cu+-exporting ATPase